MHPDAEVLADFLHHGRQDTRGQGGTPSSSHGEQNGATRPSAVQQGVDGRPAAAAAARTVPVLPPPKPTPAPVPGSLPIFDSQSSTTATSTISSVAAVASSGRSTTAGDVPKVGGGVGEGEHGEGVGLGAGAGAAARTESRGTAAVAPAPPRRGSKGTCMVRVLVSAGPAKSGAREYFSMSLSNQPPTIPSIEEEVLRTRKSYPPPAVVAKHTKCRRHICVCGEWCHTMTFSRNLLSCSPTLQRA